MAVVQKDSVIDTRCYCGRSGRGIDQLASLMRRMGRRHSHLASTVRGAGETRRPPEVGQEAGRARRQTDRRLRESQADREVRAALDIDAFFRKCKRVIIRVAPDDLSEPVRAEPRCPQEISGRTRGLLEPIVGSVTLKSGRRPDVFEA
jgi:hypothetical protein